MKGALWLVEMKKVQVLLVEEKEVVLSVDGEMEQDLVLL